MTRDVLSASAMSTVADAAEWLRAQVPAGADLACDSRAVRPGSVFFACPGERGDGRDHIAQAVGAGAAAVLHDAAGGFAWRPEWSAPHLAVPGLRVLAGSIASRWWDQPSERLSVVAITGTNGKTSCSHWVAQALAACGRRCGVVGTLGAGEPGRLQPFGLTTPDAVTLQRLLAGFVQAGLQGAAIEASSIGLHQRRLDGTRVRTAVFTNLTRDHLDYHADMRAYADAKASLFAWPGLQAAVVNLDDPAAPEMLRAVPPGGARRIGFSVGEAARGPAARPAVSAAVDGSVRAARIAPVPRGTAVLIDGDWGREEVELSLFGHHNVQNALAVLGALLAEGIGLRQAAGALSALSPVPGRMQAVAIDGAPLAVIDYAHTPDALANVLAALRPVAAARGGRLWCVFGAGGDRDPGKRPLMGEIAARLADAVVLTSDNPRSEPAEAILAQIARGMQGASHRIVPDRRVAIETALREAAARDVVLIAGKGHEDYQEANGRRVPFSDVEVARAALACLIAEGAHA